MAKRTALTRRLRGPAAVAAALMLLLPAASFSLELFDGNLGYDGNWLHVIDAPAMTDRVYWEDLGADFTYQAQCATDLGFQAVVVEEAALDTNYMTPALPAGAYYFRAREVDSSGTPGGWSAAGTLDVVEDTAWPGAQILSPLSGSFSAGDPIAIELEVVDDTVLHVAQFRLNGEYVGALGLKTENYKVKPSFGVPRTVVFETEVPKGKGPLEISVIVSDVTYKQVTTSLVVEEASGGSRKGGKGGRGR